MQNETLIYRGLNLLTKAIAEIRKSKELISKSGTSQMLKKLFEAVEAILRAVIYLLILIMGLSIAGLGAYFIFFLSIRMGQFFFELLFSEKWL